MVTAAASSVIIYYKNDQLSYSSPSEQSAGYLAVEVGSVIVILQVGKLKDGSETLHQQTDQKINQGEIQRQVSPCQTPPPASLGEHMGKIWGLKC